MSSQYKIQYFLGSNTKKGFASLFEQLRDPLKGRTMYILKGGPGSGKSSLMKRIGATLEEMGHRLEYFPCASDPESLDALLDYDAFISIVDGTAPHTMDPKYPGAYEIMINLGEAWDQKELSRNKTKIIELSDLISSYHSMAGYCITAATTLLDTNRSIAMLYVDRKSIQDAIHMLTDQLSNGKKGEEHKRLLSAVSVGRIVFFDQTLKALCPKLYLIPDQWGAAAGFILREIHEYALSMKLEVFTCYCSIEGKDKIDHLLFPSLGIGVTTSNSFHKTDPTFGISIDDLMLQVPDADAAVLRGNLETAGNLLDSAAGNVEKAKLLHDQLEAFYIASMDFTKLDAIYDRLLEEILRPN